MFPLWTSVRLGELCLSAYCSAERTSRGALGRHRFDANTAGLRKANLLHPHLATKEGDHLLRLCAASGPFDTSVDVFRILTEDHHVHVLRALHRRGNALEVANGSHAGVQVQLLTKGHVERTKATPNRRSQRALDRHKMVSNCGERLFGHVRVECRLRFLTRQDFSPDDAPPVTVCLRDCTVKDELRSTPDIGTGAVAFDKRDDRNIRNAQCAIAHRDWQGSGAHMRRRPQKE